MRHRVDGWRLRARIPATFVLAVSLVLGACTSPGPPPVPAGASALPPPVPGTRPPASPADSPALGRPPAGTVIPVGAGAEGVAVDPTTRTAAVGTRDPNELVLVDTGTGRVRSRTPLPGHLRHLQNGAPGMLLVPDENADQLLAVALPAGQVTAALPTGASPHYAVVARDGTVFVANEAGHSVAVVRDGHVVASLPDAVLPGGMALTGDRLGLVDVASDTLTLYDSTSLARLTTVALGDGPTHEVADDRGDLVAADTRGEALQFVVPQVPPLLRSRVALPGSPYGLAYDPVHDRLWVTLTARNEVVGFDTRVEPPREIARYPTVRQPNTVAVDPTSASLYVTGSADGVLETIPGSP